MKKIKYLLIDTSYFVFYRYYAVLNWLKRYKNESINIESLMENTEYIDKYKKTFENNLKDLMKTYDVLPENIYWIKDCPRENIWRLDLYPQYKANRDEKLNSFNKDIFKYTYNSIIPNLIESYKFKELSYDKMEADDIICVFTKILKENEEAIIITNDNDFIQLISDNVSIYNLQGKELKSRITNIDTYLQKKIIIGDKSDNIPSIAKKCGDKTADKLLENLDLLTKYLENTCIKQQYDLNKKLIDMNYIPKEFFDNMSEIINKIKN